MFESQRQVTTGKRIHSVSDDPFGATQVIGLRSLKAASEQYKKNVDTARGYLGFSEVALGESHDIMRRAYELAVRGANGATDQMAREGMVTEIQQLQQRILDLANARGPSGQYLFAGQDSGNKPFVLNGNSLTYGGDAFDVVVETSPTETLAINTKGDPLFIEAYDRLETLKNNLMGGNVSALSGVSIPELQTSMRDLNAARGVVGVKLQEVERLQADHVRRIDEFTRSISDVEDVDLAEAITKYQMSQVAYEAALNVAANGFKLSLMDFMR